MIPTLDVYLWGQKVGTLVEAENKRGCFFYYDEDFVKGNYDPFPLRASVKSDYAIAGKPFYPPSDKIFEGLPSFISDSLPDQWGSTIFKKWAEQHRIQSKKISSLDKLAYIGKRGMGALEFQPSMAKDMEASVKLKIDDLHTFSLQTLREQSAFKTKLDAGFLIESLFKVGTSAGGKHPKAIVNVNPSTGECLSGQVASPEPGFVPMIIKFDEKQEIPFTRIEYSYYLMAQKAGLPMTDCSLLESGKVAHFLTKRYDRDMDYNKVHVQTLAAMDPLSNSYEDLFKVGSLLNISKKEMGNLFLQMAMNVLAGNVDDHNKNFAFLMNKDGQWHPTPAYDFTFTVNPKGFAYQNQHSLSINDKTKDFTKSDLLGIAQKYSISSAEKILVQAAHVCNTYAEFGKKAGVSDKWIGLIENEIKERINLMFGLHPGEKLPLLPHKKKPQRKPSDTGGPKLK